MRSASTSPSTQISDIRTSVSDSVIPAVLCSGENLKNAAPDQVTDTTRRRYTQHRSSMQSRERQPSGSAAVVCQEILELASVVTEDLMHFINVVGQSTHVVPLVPE